MENKKVCINSCSRSASENNTVGLPCSFIRVKRNGRPALVAQTYVQVDAVSDEFASALRLHVNELNMRLPSLNVSVSSFQGNRFCFVLQGLSGGEINADSTSRFLTLLSQDIRTFVAYLGAHNIVAEFS